MRLLEKIQQHLRFWWQRFHGGDLPSSSDLLALLVELQNVARDFPAIELPLIAQALPSGRGGDHAGIIPLDIVQEPSIYSSMKECLRKLLHADKRNTVEFVKQLALEGMKTGKTMDDLVDDCGGSLWVDVFFESLDWCSVGQRGSITASEILHAVDAAMKDVDGVEPSWREFKDPLDALPSSKLALLESIRGCLRRKLGDNPDDALLENVKKVRDCLSGVVLLKKTIREFLTSMTFPSPSVRFGEVEEDDAQGDEVDDPRFRSVKRPFQDVFGGACSIQELDLLSPKDILDAVDDVMQHPEASVLFVKEEASEDTNICSEPFYPSDRGYCPAALLQFGLETNWGGRNERMRGRKEYCSLTDRENMQCWDHHKPQHKRADLDAASLLLRCLQTHLRRIGEERLAVYNARQDDQGLKREEMPRSGSADPNIVTQHWVRPQGVKLLQAFSRVEIDILKASCTMLLNGLKPWLWKKVSRHGKKQHLIPEEGEDWCRSELGWPGFWMTNHQFNIVIHETIQDYATSRQYIEQHRHWKMNVC